MKMSLETSEAFVSGFVFLQQEKYITEYIRIYSLNYFIRKPIGNEDLIKRVNKIINDGPIRIGSK